MTTATRYPRRGGRRPLLPCRMEETRKHVASTSNPMAFPDQLGADHDDIEVRPAPTWRPPLPTKPLIRSYFLFSFILARPSSPVTSPPLLPWVLSETCSVPRVEKPPSHPSCSCRPDEMATSAPSGGVAQLASPCRQQTKRRVRGSSARTEKNAVGFKGCSAAIASSGTFRLGG